MLFFFFFPSHIKKLRVLGGFGERWWKEEQNQGGMGSIGTKQGYSPVQTHEWQKERTQQDCSSNRMCMKKPIQARVIWHTHKSCCHRVDTVAYRRWRFWKLCKTSPHLSDSPSPCLTCWWLHHFLRDCGQVPRSKCLCGHHLRQERLRFPETIWPKALNSLISLSPHPQPKVHILPFNLWRPFRRDIMKSKGHCFNLNQFNTKFLEIRALGFSLAVLDVVFFSYIDCKTPYKT